MNPIDRLRASAQETTRIANAIMANPHASEADFTEAFRARDVAYVESLGLDEEQLAELRWETGCGCNGADSPFHTYFGFEQDREFGYSHGYGDEDEGDLNYDEEPSRDWESIYEGGES